MTNIARTKRILAHLQEVNTSEFEAALTNSDPAPGYGGSQDLGGVENYLSDLIDKEPHEYAYWERQIDALCGLLIRSKRFSVHALRRGIEAMEPKAYAESSYYDKWAFTLVLNCIEKGLITNGELQEKIKRVGRTVIKPKFKIGDEVQVLDEDKRSRWRKPHIRTPGYIFGQKGVIERYCGAFGNPELHAFGVDGPEQPLYRIRFNQKQVWKDYEGHETDTIDVEIYQHWLQRPTFEKPHEHMPRADVEAARIECEAPQTAYQILAEAFVELVVQKGVVTKDEIRARIEEVDMATGSTLGPDIVVRAWTDKTFKEELLTDAKAVLNSYGYTVHQDLIVVENTSQVHNLVVCTLCSCYPREILGIPPDWYKSYSYRARAVKDPRGVLAEFGVNVPEKQVRVHDSTADMRYIVLPKRPDGTDEWTEEQLKAIVTRDSMIGTSVPSV